MSEAKLDNGHPDYPARFGEIRKRIERRLTEVTPTSAGAPRLSKAIRYSLLDGGKRMRPLITLLTAEALGGSDAAALDPACAIEMVHTASLVIDDLPCMDDAQQRRGKRTSHLEHGEDIAILGAITLISEAFGLISRSPHLDDADKVALTDALSGAIGLDGLCAGQERDLRDIGSEADAVALEQLQMKKTGALFVLSLEAGARVAGLHGQALEPLRGFGRHAGLAFQILDDLLDAVGDDQQMGKETGQDDGKHTFAAIMSVDAAERLAEQELAAALDALTPASIDSEPFAAYLDLVLKAYHSQTARSVSVRVGVAG